MKNYYLNVPLDQIDTDVSRREMKELLYLCTKNVNFSFDNSIYNQSDGQYIPILANLFVVELERSETPGLANKLNNWRRYSDDTICYVKVDSIYYVLSKLNFFYINI